jgi:hypothetical protein
MSNYSPQMIEKLDSKWLPLATASVLGQAPSISQTSRVVGLYAVTRLLQSAGSLKYQAALGGFMEPDWAPPKRQLPKVTANSCLIFLGILSSDAIIVGLADLRTTLEAAGAGFEEPRGVKS